MLKHTYNNHADLRRKTGFSTYYRYHKLRISISDCMVILVVFAVLLFSIMAVSATPNPNVMFGI